MIHFARWVLAVFSFMHLTLNGKKWCFKRPARIVINGEECDGACSQRTKTIEVRRELEGRRELVVSVHEIRHGLNDYVDEHYVETEAEDLGGALWKLGYRKLTREQIRTLEIK